MQSSLLWTSQTWNMSRETNEEFMMRFQTITMNFSTLVHILVESITPLAQPKAYLEAYISVIQLPLTVTSSKPVISTSLFSFFFFGNMLRYNRYSWGTVESHVWNSADRCRGIKTTGKMMCMTSRNCISIIYLIKGRYVLCWGTSIRWKIIVEAILGKSFW